MPSWLERLFEDIRNLWQKLPTSQKWLVGGVSAALLLLLVGVSMTTFVIPSSDYFMGDLSASQMSEATKFLDENNVTYDIGEDSSSIYVYGDADKLKYEYAAAKATKTLGGNRVLLGPNWSQTKEQFDELRLRALEEELAQTIEKGGNIEWARVHLTRRQRALFPSGDTKATASVSIKSKSGGDISRNEVEGIQWLVANSLPGLEPVNVKVIGDRNQPLEGFAETSESEQVANEQRKAEKALEEKKNAMIARILDPVVGGPQNYTSSVILELDYDKLEIEETFVDTESPLAVKVRTEESSEETNQTGGVPGTESNNPADRLGQNVGTGTESQSSEELSEKEYRPRLERKQSRVVAPGAILSQHVSVVINEREVYEDGEVKYEARTPEQLAKLE
ncbi:MAG: flagellar M-ring protein FliF, partial [Candidatus Omnitrophica bacterium]|nr:flagellar M-ring protein FliF [Candidatus Omnitrophota bacterium]